MRTRTLAIAAAFGSLIVFYIATSTAATLDSNLMGRDCRGTFKTGRGASMSQGPVHLRFYEKGGALALEIKSRNSREAYESPLAGISAGEARDSSALAVSGSEARINIQFVAANGSLWTLAYSPANGRLAGQVDPTYNNPAHRTWRVAAVNLSCGTPSVAMSNRIALLR